MTYGFNCVNSDGFMQIDGANDNIAILTTGTATAQAFNGTGVTTITYPSNRPSEYLVFAKPSNVTASSGIPFALVESYDYTTFKFLLPRGSTDSISIDWAIGVKHSDMATGNSAGWGIKVFNESGGTSFSSDNKNFRCQQVTFETINNLLYGSATQFTVNNMADTYSLMSGKSHAGYTWSGNVRILHNLFVVYDTSAGFNASDGVIKTQVRELEPRGFSMAGGQSSHFRSADITNLIGFIV